MADLSHWGFAESFTAHEAAVLILGINDEEAHLEKNALRIGVITRRMKQAYSLSLDCEILSIFGGEFPPADSGGDTLESIELDKAKSYDEGAFAEWLKSSKSAFEKQLFSRAKLTRWIAAVKQNSKYQFERQAPEARQPASPAGQKTWTPARLAELEEYCKTHTQSEAATHYGVSRQRIAELLKKAGNAQNTHKNKAKKLPSPNDPFGRAGKINDPLRNPLRKNR